jgi:hypothetical protein
MSTVENKAVSLPAHSDSLIVSVRRDPPLRSLPGLALSRAIAPHPYSPAMLRCAAPLWWRPIRGPWDKACASCDVVDAEVAPSLIGSIKSLERERTTADALPFARNGTAGRGPFAYRYSRAAFGDRINGPAAVATMMRLR